MTSLATVTLVIFRGWYIGIAIAGILILRHLTNDERRLTYDSDFGNPSDVLSRWNKGFVIDGKRRLSEKDSFRNVMLCGSVGSYKSSVVAIPFLREIDDAVLIINDISGELLQESHLELIEKGYDIKVFRLRDPRTSIGFNPLFRCTSKGAVNRVATAIVESNMSGSGDPFWSKSATSVLSTFIMMLREHGPEYAHLSNLLYCLRVFQSEPKRIDQLFLNTSEDVFLAYKSIINTSERTLSGIIATAIASLQLLDDQDVAQVTSYDILGDLSNIRTTKTAIFVQNSVLDIQYLRFISDIFFEQLIESIMSGHPAPTDFPVYMVFDEFASSMKLQNAGRVFATLRKYRCGILAITQNGKSQLQENYSPHEAQSIVSNCANKLWLSGGLDLESAKRLERVGGRFEGIDEEGRKKTRELLTEAEALLLPPKQALFEVSGYPLMKLHLTPHFERLKYMLRKSEPYAPIQRTPPDIIKIPIPCLKKN